MLDSHSVNCKGRHICSVLLQIDQDQISYWIILYSAPLHLLLSDFYSHIFALQIKKHYIKNTVLWCIYSVVYVSAGINSAAILIRLSLRCALSSGKLIRFRKYASSISRRFLKISSAWFPRPFVTSSCIVSSF